MNNYRRAPIQETSFDIPRSRSEESVFSVQTYLEVEKSNILLNNSSHYNPMIFQADVMHVSLEFHMQPSLPPSCVLWGYQYFVEQCTEEPP